MNSFRRYENGMIKEEDLLDRNIIRPWKKLLIKDFILSGQPDSELAEKLEGILAEARIKGWTAEEPQEAGSKLGTENLLVIKETIEELNNKNDSISTNMNSHILHYWRDEASSNLKNKVYELFNLYEEAYNG